MQTFGLCGGQFFDGTENAPIATDVLLEDGRIAAMGNGVGKEAEVQLDLRGRFFSAGWVDVHTHLFHRPGYLGLSAVPFSLQQGVTYVIDQGSAGADCFASFSQQILKPLPMGHKAFLNCSKIGIPLSFLDGPGELADRANLDEGALLSAYEAQKEEGEVIGLKIRLTPSVCPDNPLGALQTASRWAKDLHLPLEVHPNFAPISTEALLSCLKPGDIYTHTYHPSPVGILDEKGAVKDCVWRAREQGIFFDLAHGVSSLSFPVMEQAFAQGFYPDFISTDLHNGNFCGPVYSLAHTMTKCLAFGLSLPQIIHRVTAAPVHGFGLKDKVVAPSVGDWADFTVFHLENTPQTLSDGRGHTHTAQQQIVVDATFYHQQWYPTHP